MIVVVARNPSWSTRRRPLKPPPPVPTPSAFDRRIVVVVDLESDGSCERWTTVWVVVLLVVVVVVDTGDNIQGSDLLRVN